ncbi:TetR/AcrR family transcriptional regulator [Aeromicrobium sp. Sec7.5]|uniref:TetR/AcrR family transcriptional regulator n=1 Tax=Aeromicrobium sp. Sec7.5 TaxID=3121276 RepID=UPI002FE4841D
MEARERLVQAGVELLEAHGLAGMTQRQIAVRAGVSHGAPRHHFPTYAHLLAAIAREGVEELDDRITTSLAADDPREALTSACHAVIEFAVARPAMFELIARHDLLEGAGGRLREVTGRWLGLLSERMVEVRPQADHRHGLALWAGIQGLGVMLGRRSGEAITDEGVDATAVVDVLLDGVLGKD